MSRTHARLRTRLHAYRQLGPRAGTVTAVRHVTRTGRRRLRGLMLHGRSLRVGDSELAAALGGVSGAQAFSAGANALPAVSRWVGELSALGEAERADLLQRADHVLAHRFDLLGSGATDLGPAIDWHVDFKTQRRWPPHHISRIRISYGDGSDIKVPWELSRFAHLPLVAAAYRMTGERRYLQEIGAQLTSWLDANPVEIGVNWASTMDVAIRAVNWVAALAVCPDAAAREPWAQPVLESLLLHARFIRGHLEDGTARGNHYLSDVVGLLVLSAIFVRSAEGRRWARWAIGELGREMRHQVRSDGCDHEASTSYHRLVCELFIVGADAADAIMPGELDAAVRQTVDRMLAFVADYTRPDGLAPQLGDVDDGRLLPLADYAGADQRSHLHLFGQARRRYQPATESAAYPEGGFYILRAGNLYAAVRCGDVGIYGRGCHAHNDLIAFELACGATPLIVDPGSFLYTADPDARNAFRSTAAHSALQLDGAEQNEIRADRLFAMVDTARPTVLEWTAGPTTTILRGAHRGFERLAPPARYTRTLRLDGACGTLQIADEVTSDGAHDLSLALPLAPCQVEERGDRVIARFDGVTLDIRAHGLRADLRQGWLSPSYGVRIPAPVVRLHGRSQPGTHCTAVVLAVTAGTDGPSHGQ